MTEAAQDTAPLFWWRVWFTGSDDECAALLGPCATAEEARALAKVHAPQLGVAAEPQRMPSAVMQRLETKWRGRSLTLDELSTLDDLTKAIIGVLVPKAVEQAERVAVTEASTKPLSSIEEAPIKFYFGEGKTISERSPSGAMHEGHGMYSKAAIQYENDLRSGRVKLAHNEVFDRLGKEELEYGEPEDRAVYGRGGSVIAWEDGETVEIQHETRNSGGIEPNIKAMMRWADADAVLRAMQANDPMGPEAFKTIAKVYGEEGERFEFLALSGEKCFRGHGRIASLYVTTAHGKRLLEWSAGLRKAAGQPVDDQSMQGRMEAEIRSASGQSSKEREIRRAMLEKARRSAEPVFWRACTAWRKALAAAKEPGRARWTGGKEAEARELARLDGPAKGRR